MFEDILMLIGILPITKPEKRDDINFLTVLLDGDRIRNKIDRDKLFKLLKK